MEENPAGRETQSGRRAGVGRIATGLGLAVVLAVVVATFLANTGIPTTGHPTAGDLRPPAALAGAPLAESMRGPAAPQAREIHGRTVFSTAGLGARHFYYQSGNNVLWLQAPEGLAETALQELLAHYP